MKTLTTPLVASYNQRSFTTPAGKDQLFKACIFTKIVNSATGATTWYTEKRSGLVAGDASGAGVAGTGIWLSPSLSLTTGGLFAAFGNTTSTIYMDKIIGSTVNCGTLSSYLVGFNDTTISGITYILITAGDGTGWFIPSDATAALTYTADGNNSTTISDIKIAGVNSTAGLYAGQKLTAGSNIVAGTRIVSVNSGAFTAVIDTATTGGAFNDLSITKEPVAKITDPDFPTTIVGNFAEMDGYVFIMTSDGKIYNSDLNSITSWGATSFVTAGMSTDGGVGCIKHKNYIAAFGGHSIEFFYNAGNPSGSPLNRADQLATNIGTSGGIRALTKAGNTVFFMSQDTDAKQALHKLDGFVPVPIPSQGIDFSASAITGGLNAFPYAGQTIVNIMGPTSYWYSVENNIFVEPALPASAYFAQHAGAAFAAYCVLTDTSGFIYTLPDAGANFADNSVAYTMTAQIQTDMGTNLRKFAMALRVNADIQSAGSLSVSYSDDDGATFSTPRAIPLTASRMLLTRLGSFEGKRLWKFQDAGNNANRIKTIAIDYDLAAA